MAPHRAALTLLRGFFIAWIGLQRRLIGLSLYIPAICGVMIRNIRLIIFCAARP
jgi:hypothetical protein